MQNLVPLHKIGPGNANLVRSFAVEPPYLYNSRDQGGVSTYRFSRTLRVFKRTMTLQRCQGSTMRRGAPFSSMLLAFLGLAVMAPVTAQPGLSLCACNPAVYTFELDFDALCEDTNVEGLGIENSDCFTAPAGSNQDIENFTPVQITEIQILELDQNLVPFTFTPVIGNFRNGDTFTYSSITARRDDLPEDLIPRGFQITLIGLNPIDQDIQNVWIITFTNECGVFPVFTVGEQIGWTRLIDFENPVNQYCPGKFGRVFQSQPRVCHCMACRSSSHVHYLALQILTQPRFHRRRLPYHLRPAHPTRNHPARLFQRILRPIPRPKKKMRSQIVHPNPNRVRCPRPPRQPRLPRLPSRPSLPNLPSRVGRCREGKCRVEKWDLCTKRRASTATER